MTAPLGKTRAKRPRDEAASPLAFTEDEPSTQAWERIVHASGYPRTHIRRETTSLGRIASVSRDEPGREILVAAYLDGPLDVDAVVKDAHERRAEYALLFSAARARTLRVGALGGRPVDRAPPLFPAAVRHPLSRQATLPPWRSEHELRRVVGDVHTELFTEMSKDPAAAFDEILKFLIAKIYDERQAAGRYEFFWDRSASDEENMGRVRALFKRAAAWADVTRQVARDDDGIHSSARAMKTAVEAFQDNSILETAAATDVQGVVYETVVGSTFRGELGSYFTPRNIVDFMVHLAGPKPGDRIFDISCGSGGFLVGAVAVADGGAVRVYGVDINPRMVRAARLNLLLHGQEPSQILHAHGLALEENLRSLLPDFDETVRLAPAESTLLGRLASGPFDIVLANPPFAGHEKDESLLKTIETARNLERKSLNRTLPFVEAIIASLRVGGVAGMVLPVSILNAEEPSFAELRKVILEHSEVLAILDLPRHAFTHTDCGVEGALLFVKRTSRPRKRYPVFVAQVRNLGYDRLGKPTRENDLPKILERFRAADEHHQVDVEALRKAGRWDPLWILRAQKDTHEPHTLVPLTDLVRVRRESFARKRLQEDKEYTFFEVGDCDINTGAVRNVRTASGFELKKKGRIKQVVRAGDILLPNHRDSLIAKTADSAGRSVVVVPRELDGALTTDRFLMLTPLCDRDYLVALLNSRGFRERLIPHSRGSASLDLRPTVLEKIRVPDPSTSQDLLQQLREWSQTEEQLRADLARITELRISAINGLFEG